MIRCPECGQDAADDVKFCDRCGQGLTASAIRVVAIEPLPPGTELKGVYRILELTGHTSDENRYRAEPIGDHDGKIYELRERLGPQNTDAAEENPAESAGAPEPVAAPDPKSPTAKTAELRLREQANGAAPNESSTADPTSSSSSAETASSLADEGGEVALAAEADAPSTATTDPSGELSTTLEQASSKHEATLAEQVISPDQAPPPVKPDDLGEVFGRVMALSLTLNHPAIRRAQSGFASDGRVYLVYPDEQLISLAQRMNGTCMSESAAITFGLQLCQAVAFFHRHALRVNDLCPDSIVFDSNGRLKLTGLDYVSNDNELQETPIFNDGYTAPEIYRAKKVDKRADIFSIGALLYSCLTGERLESETWREEAGPIRFYPPHVLTPSLEQIIRRAIGFEPKARFANIDELKGELIKFGGYISIRAAALTDVGMVRALNEDSIMALEYRQESLVHPDHAFLYVVADGMGGAEAGEVASAIAVDAIRAYVEQRRASTGHSQLPILLREALEDANRKVLDYAAAHPEARGLGSTAVASLIDPPDATIAWVGDSRAYFWEDGHLRQLSKDHSLVQRLVEIGQITLEEARHHEHKNVITRSLGARTNGPAGAEALPLFRLKRGDRILLCSDGLTAHVEDDRISEIIGRHDEPDEAARELIVAANAGGGSDNISVVVIFVD